MTSWACRVENASQLTVGAHFELDCTGPAILPLQVDSLSIQDDKGEAFGLKILEVKALDTQHLQAVVTSYTPGEYKNATFTLSDGKQSLKLEGISFQLQSVLKKDEKQEPYPAYPPWAMSLPLWFWGVLIFAVVIPVYLIWRLVKKENQRRKLIEKLQKQRTARLPFDEFHRELRQLEKKHGLEPSDPQSYVKDLNDVFRLYLVRELIVPAQDWRDGAILSEIRKKARPVYDSCEKELRGILRELHRATRTVPTVADCHQLAGMARNVSEDIFNSTRKRGRL